ncbi:MAG: FHA domain-containing protein [Deltaproteobacteria bacterium]|nr:FHA domain-containing protein [Deltaproteobacteria bacterium]
MALLGLELSDAGILVAGGEPARLLPIDGKMLESPGYAVPEKKHLLVGRSAEGKAHLLPLQVNNRFWDQLNTEPLEKKTRHAQNHAEIACDHLSLIWENVKMHGDDMIIAVPDYYGREHLGLILGMAQELSIPLKGFVSLPIAASVNPWPDAMLLHLDIHLHRFEITYLHQGKDLTREQSTDVQEIKLEQLYRKYVESIAEEFVRNTRFDPLHKAATEQALYNRLPAALEILKVNSSFLFEISHGKHIYRITLSRDRLKRKSAPTYDEILNLIGQMRAAHGKNDFRIVLQLTHRMGCLPGLKDKLSTIDNCEITELDPGAAAMGVLGLVSRLPRRQDRHGVSYSTSRPWRRAARADARTSPEKRPDRLRATHLLHRDMAYPLSGKPLIIGSSDDPDGENRHIRIRSSGISGKHCKIQRDKDTIVITDCSRQGTFVDGQKVEGNSMMEFGQTIRLGTSEETLRLIACVEGDET